MTVLYDGTTNSKNLLNSILINQSSTNDPLLKEITFVFNRNAETGLGKFTAKGFLTSVSQSVSVGTVQACSCNFQISGDWQSGDQNQGTF